AVSAVPLRASFDVCMRHKNPNSGPAAVSGEILRSLRTHDERWASIPTVVQSSDNPGSAASRAAAMEIASGAFRESMA
ncbi:MAG: hypothetical protein OXD30_06045, partial [Bryobacterales bacterium]|nr:hypothetical protein [Bryobacterales bacterium]